MCIGLHFVMFGLQSCHWPKRIFLVIAIVSFLLSDSKLLESFFDKAMVKLRQEDMAAASKHLVFDLAHCFVPYLSLDSLNSLFGYLTPLLDVSC